MNFRIETTFADDVAILCCHGHVSSPEAMALSHAVAPLLSERGTIILNFRGVQLVDGGGLGTLALLQLYARSFGRSLRFCSLNPRVTQAVQRTSLAGLFDIYATEEEAIPA